jgi:ubiquinone/menaquinone biosynthesis C-methylase UbiE
VHKTSIAAAGAVAIALGLAPGTADAQLASRPAAEWKATLEAPARVAGLKIEEVVKALKLKMGDYVADLGAGTGLFEPQLAYAIGTRGRVYAVEIDKGFLDEIDRKVDELHISSIETVLGTPTDPKLPMQGIDVALMHDVLHHVEQRQAYLKAVAGYLKPSGRIAVVEFHAKDSPHKDDAALIVSKEQGDALMAEAGFVPDEEVALFADKWFVIYRRR